MTAEEVTRTTLDRIERTQASLRAFISVHAERALERARSVDRALARGEDPGLLAGVPVAIKDNICTRFGTTTCGSRMLRSFRSPYDAHVVERLESAGAIIVGKTNLDEFAMGSSTEYSAQGPTRNPWATDRVAGGSSGGSAAAAAAGIVPCAFGSDTGGSIRQPASFCGVVGLKPSYGRVSRYGLVAFGSSLDQIGPIARDVRDVARLLEVIAGHDDRDSTSADVPTPDYSSALQTPVAVLRVGVSETFAGAGAAPGVRSVFERALQLLERSGARLVPIDLPHLRHAVACYYLLAPAEASSNLSRFTGMQYGVRENVADLHEAYTRSRGRGFGTEVKRRIMLGTFALSSGYYDAYYLKAAKVRAVIKRDFDQVFQKVDVIASPVAPTTAFRVGEKTDDPLAMYLSDVYTVPANLAGNCAISVPAGFDDGGLPVGLQLSAPAFAEAQLLAAAYQFQQCVEAHLEAPPLAESL